MLTITEAAAAAGVSDRTLRKYDRAGRISRVEGPDGRPRYRRDEVEALSTHKVGTRVPNAAEGDRNGSEGFGSPAAEAVGTDRKASFRTPDKEPLNGARHESGPWLSASDSSRAELLAAIQRERDRAIAEADHLRDQLEVRNRAEAELRVMLAHLEQTNAQLAGALCQKALPPASDLLLNNTPRVKWWSLWRRKV